MLTTNIGFPNVYKSKIKRAVEGFWKGKKTAVDVATAEQEVLAFNARSQRSLDLRPIGDIDLYDRLLRTAVMFGWSPSRFGPAEQVSQDLSAYLSIPRGTQTAKASPMTKWFNTNYHVVQPEIDVAPKLVSKPFIPQDIQEEDTKVALIGPWTLLQYAINKTTMSQETLFEKLAIQYIDYLAKMPDKLIQLEEPSFITNGVPDVYQDFLTHLSNPIHLHTYFGSVNHIAEGLFDLPVDAIGLDFIDGPSNLELLADFPEYFDLIAGVVNGRNVWPATTKTEELLNKITEHVDSETLYISPSCSLQHVPLSAEKESLVFSFALEKLDELEKIASGDQTYKALATNDFVLPTQPYEPAKQRFTSPLDFPTTTIGSFPQTPARRKMRKDLKRGNITQEDADTLTKGFIQDDIAMQEELGLDVLVHGEAERNDMIQYFAEHFANFEPIHSPVQSYGTRLVRPPVITGKVSRPKAFTVPWITYAQSLTDKPVKGMLTGPTTLVQWSYPREDVPLEQQFYEMAEALHDEVYDLVRAGITHIQIDEPALREVLPTDKSKWDDRLFHATNAFKRVFYDIGGIEAIYAHMCFSEFSDITEWLPKLEADVFLIEDSKAQGKTAQSLIYNGYPEDRIIGMGTYDVHSPRVPSVEEIVAIPELLLKSGIAPSHIGINPDCGLKTRTQEEAYQQLDIMMQAVRKLREEYS